MAQKGPIDPTKRKIILYTSLALSEVEQRYSQVEREALAVVWACERLKLYLFGKVDSFIESCHICNSSSEKK